MVGYGDRHVFSAVVDLNSGSLTSTPLVAFSQRVQIHVLAATVTESDAGGAVIAFEDQNSSPTAIESVTVPSGDQSSQMFYTKLLRPYVLEPGHYISITVTESGTAPAAILIVEYSLLDEQLASDNDSAIESA